MATIAFIGVGNMGGGMAANLVKAGHVVRAFDLSPEALDRARGNGCAIAGSAAEAATTADAVVTMLPAGAHVRAAYENELFAAAAPGAVLIDCSTIDVATAKLVGEAPRRRGRRRHADLHGRRPRSRLRRCPADP
jgi:3-hydroxyisobutyrate dehydrogenase